MKSYNKKREHKRKAIKGEEAGRIFFADVFQHIRVYNQQFRFSYTISKLSILLEIHVKFSLYPQHPFNSKQL